MNGNRYKSAKKKKKKESNVILDFLWIGLCVGAVGGISVMGLFGIKSFIIGLCAGGIISTLIGYFVYKNK